MRMLSRKAAAAIVGAIALLSAISGCSDPQGAKQAAEAEGFTDVRAGGHSFFGCGPDDSYATEFSGKGANGKCVTGVVCSAWLKGSTVRITGSQTCVEASR